MSLDVPLDEEEHDRWRATLGVPVPADTAAALRRLSRHYIPARYPDAHPSGTAGAHYGESDADEALADADHVLSFVDAAWETVRA